MQVKCDWSGVRSERGRQSFKLAVCCHPELSVQFSQAATDFRPIRTPQIMLVHMNNGVAVRRLELNRRMIRWIRGDFEYVASPVVEDREPHVAPMRERNTTATSTGLLPILLKVARNSRFTPRGPEKSVLIEGSATDNTVLGVGMPAAVKVEDHQSGSSCQATLKEVWTGKPPVCEK